MIAISRMWIVSEKSDAISTSTLTFDTENAVGTGYPFGFPSISFVMLYFPV